MQSLVNRLVRNSAGEDLGRVDDIVLDPETGRIRYIILSLSGLTGPEDQLFAVPWSSFNFSQSRDYLVLNVDKFRLAHAPGFPREHWPDMAAPVWKRQIEDYYGGSMPIVRERTVYVERPREPRGVPVLSGVLIIALVFALLWVGYVVSSRGWDQARQDLTSTFQRAAYAAKEGTQDVALTAKVKTALSLSKRVPAGNINVNSDSDVVTLSGEVPSDQVRNIAEAITRDVPGVREVHNDLYVRSR
jgi:hypothetical protein